MRKIGKIIIAMLAATGLSAGEVVAPNGKPYRQIVVAEQAPSMVQLAAKELATFLQQTAGAELPIVNVADKNGPAIFIGAGEWLKEYDVDSATLPPEGFVIKSMPDALVIAGRDLTGPLPFLEKNPWRPMEMWNQELGLCALGEAGTLYGVYRFLEDIAQVRWYWPGEDGTVIEPVERLTVPEYTLNDAPVFHYRYPWFCFGELSKDDLLWLRRAGFGGVAPVYIMHSYHQMLKYKDSNPEFFALVDGKRDFDNLCCVGGGGHLCLTNLELKKKYVQIINQYFTDHPEQLVFPLVPMDGLTRVCSCENCQKEIDYDLPENEKFSNYIWKFTNDIALEVAKTHPDRFVGCLGYEHYTAPPSRIEKLADNVAVMICYARIDAASPRGQEKVRGVLENWKLRTSHIYTWNWYLEHWTPWRGLPTANMKFYADEYRYLTNLGVWGGEFIEAEGNEGRGDDVSKLSAPGMQHLKLYISARAMWNPDFDEAAVVAEYYDKFYGPAAEPMKNFFETATSSYMAAAAELKSNGGKKTLSPEDVYTPSLLTRLSDYLDSATKLVNKETVYSRRIKVVADEFNTAKQSLIRFSGTGNQQLRPAKISGPDELDQLELKRFLNKDGTLPVKNTWMAVGYNHDNLYLKFYAFEPDMAKLCAKRTTHDEDAMWEDDTFEIFLSPDMANKENCYQFIINANGAVWDCRHSFGVIGAPGTWDCANIHTEAVKEENRWILTVTIPWKDLGVENPDELPEMAANFYRGHAADGEKIIYTCWSPTFAPANYSVHRFGTLRFGENQ